MLKKSKIGLCLLCMVLLVVMIPFESNASGISSSMNFTVGYAQPTCDNRSGYISVLSLAGSNYSMYTYFWNIVPAWEETGQSPTCEMYITVNNSSVVFHPYVYGASGGYLTLGYYDTADNLHMVYYGQIGLNTYENTQTWSQSILGYVYGGNATGFNGQLKDVQTPAITWNNEPSAIQLQRVFQELITLNNLNEQEKNFLLAIMNNTASANSKLDTIATWLQSLNEKTQWIGNNVEALLNAQNTSNTWLEKIFNWLKDSPEQERQEATNQGNSSVSSGTSNIDDKGASFGESLGGLVSSLSYSGTDCTWTFPQVKLPAIPGIMSETVLIQQQPINFSEWINKIPSDILLLIQSISTCALIVYCFKELYSTISYALTLKGGGSDE